METRRGFFWMLFGGCAATASLDSIGANAPKVLPLAPPWMPPSASLTNLPLPPRGVVTSRRAYCRSTSGSDWKVIAE